MLRDQLDDVRGQRDKWEQAAQMARVSYRPRKHARPRAGLWLSYNLCGFRILVVLGGFYGSARDQACESNKADRHHVVAAPPLMHGKGHAGSRDQQCHQDDHAICEL
jgi:hypothetical protein